MNKIKLSAVTAALLFSPFLLLKTVHAELLYPVEIDYQPVKVKISKLNVKKHNDSVVVSGTINRHAYNSHVLPAHIDLLVLDSNKKIFQRGIINVSGLNLRHNRYGRQFRIALSNDLPQGSTIKLGWHQKSASHNVSLNNFNQQDSLL